MLIARLEGELLESKKNVEIAVRLRGEAESTNQAFEQELARVKEQLTRGDAAMPRRASIGIGSVLRSGLGMSLAAGWSRRGAPSGRPNDICGVCHLAAAI